MLLLGVPANGAAAAAPDGGALACPSVHTSTSTRWALVNPVACQAWHGRGLNEVPAIAIRGINSCREALYGGFWKNIMSVTNTKISRSAGPIWFFRD
jgi:hypothetical protein